MKLLRRHIMLNDYGLHGVTTALQHPYSLSTNN